MSEQYRVLLVNLNFIDSSIPVIIAAFGYDVQVISDEELKNIDDFGDYIALIIDDNAHGEALEYITKINDFNRLKGVNVLICSMMKNQITYLENLIDIEFDFLGKPINSSELKHRLNNCKNRYESSLYLNQVEKLSAISDTAAGISHEIKNPLAIIMGYLRNIKRKIDNGETDKVYDMIEKCLDASSRVNEIINNMQDLARGIQSDKKDHFIESILAEAEDLSQHKLRLSGVQFSIENNFPPESKSIHCNLVKIAQSLSILINNAAEAHKGCSSAWVRVVAGLSPDGNILISVIDSGEGVSLELQERIFNKFFTTKSESGGTGMGLAIAKKFLSEAKAELSLDNKSKNTCFKVEFKA